MSFKLVKLCLATFHQFGSWRLLSGSSQQTADHEMFPRFHWRQFPLMSLCFFRAATQTTVWQETGLCCPWQTACKTRTSYVERCFTAKCVLIQSSFIVYATCWQYADMFARVHVLVSSHVWRQLNHIGLFEFKKVTHSLSPLNLSSIPSASCHFKDYPRVGPVRDLVCPREYWPVTFTVNAWLMCLTVVKTWAGRQTLTHSKILY